MIAVAWIAFACAAIPALLYLWNSFLFREPPKLPSPFAGKGRSISVLIPARDEERGIAACVESVVASRHVEIEVIVLDDHSTDRTADVVRAIAARDGRIRLESAPPLPDGWCGKQAACYALSKLARHDILTFLDADVRLEPDALARMLLFQKESGAALVSGFPRQETATFLEKLLIPLIHWLLLSFLPLWAMRRFRWSAFGAGCGQWFLTTRSAYEQVGGHAAVKSSLHDGLTLPRAYRRAGFMTDLCNATNLATCRMYHSSRAVWFGLAKNAREGMAATGQIGFWTAVLFCGQVLPFVILGAEWRTVRDSRALVRYLPITIANVPLGPLFYPIEIAFLGGLCVLLVRVLAAERSRQSWLGVVFHPIAILFLLAIQWYALSRAILGNPVGWKGRPHPQPSGEPAT